MDTPKTEQAQHKKHDDAKPRETDGKPAPTLAKESEHTDGSGKSSVKAKPRRRNNVRKLRMERMMSKAELARRAGLSTLTVDRVERGMPCRMDTKRKILEALGLTPSDRVTVFGEDD